MRDGERSNARMDPEPEREQDKLVPERSHKPQEFGCAWSRTDP